MDNKLIILFFASVILSGVQSKVSMPHQSVTINQDGSYELLCEADVDIKACAWITPAGKTYVLWSGANYESGRISQHGDADRQCGISVNKAVDEDNGKWKCQVTSIDASGNAVPATREVDVTVAIPPSAVQLKIGENFKPSTYEVKMSKENKGKTVVDVECVAAAARPAPKFKWFLGGDELSATSEVSTKDNGGKKDYIATLKYFPAEMHNNKDLRCQVTHQAYSAVQTAEKANEAQLVLKISYPPVPNKVVKKHYNLNIGGENVIRMQFGANPQPTKGEWTINNVKIPVGSADAKGKYTSGSIEKKDGVEGEWEVALTIKALTEADVKGKHSLTIENEEGSETYNFELLQGEQPPPAPDSNSLTVGIIVIIVIIVIVLVLVIIARAKGMLCFAAAKGGDELDEEKEAFENVEKGESNAIVQDTKPIVETKGTPEKKLDQDAKAEAEEKKSNGAHTPV